MKIGPGVALWGAYVQTSVQNPPKDRVFQNRVVLVLLVLLLSAADGAGRAAEAPDLREAQRALHSGRYSEAVLSGQAGVAAGEDLEEWGVVLGEGLLRTGEYAAARSAMTNLLALEPRSLRLRWLAAEVFQRNGDLATAARMPREIIGVRTERPFAYRDPVDLVVFGQAALRIGVDPKQVIDRVYTPLKQGDDVVPEVYRALGGLALEKRDFALAARTFQEGLQRFPDDVELRVGLAHAYVSGETALMAAAIEEALARNPNHAGALMLLAEQHMDAEDYAQARQVLERIRSVNPHDPEAWAGEALMAHLQNQPDREAAARDAALRFWTNNPAVDHFIGRKLSQNYRFAEAAAAQRRALAFDPDYLPARAQLAQDLLRLGEEEEGWRLARQVQERDAYNVGANNLMTLHDVMARFTTLTNAHFVVRMGAQEAPVYGQRVLALLERARERLAERYGMEWTRPVLVEVFPEQKDFAVRTFGMPEDLGFLGVCFGHVITANSPASRAGQRFNWESMLWHELAHVVTLQLTRNRMPRWLSEGISVYEERQANPAWGERLTPRYRELILGGEMTPVASLSSAFASPPSPEHLQFAYYQSSLVVQFLVEKYGADRLRAILRNLGEGLAVNEAIEKHTVPMAAFQQEFEDYARHLAGTLGPSLDWEKPLPAAARLLDAVPAAAPGASTNFWVLNRQARQLAEAGDWAGARVVLERLVAACPEFTGPDSAWRGLAEACRELGDTVSEREAWAQLAARDDEASDAYLRLCELAAAAGDWAAVELNAHRYLAVDPLTAAPYRFLAQAAGAAGRPAEAISAYRALLGLDPPNPAEVHFGLARELHRAGDPEARRHVLLALEEAPRHREALRLLLAIHGGEAAPDSAPAPSPPVSTP